MASASLAANGGGIHPAAEGSTLNLTTLLAGVWGNKLTALVLAPFVAVFLWLFVAYQTSPLKNYPAPPWQVYSGEYAPRIKKLHEKFGLISDFYKNSSSVIDVKITYHMFSEVDPTKHALIKRPVPKKTCLFGDWLSYYAWDFMGMGEDKNFKEGNPDFLQYFIESKSRHPDLVNDGSVIGYLLLNLIAGADTTAIAMRALFYHVLKNPRVFIRLQSEVRAAFAPFEPASHAKARALPYLEAVVKETLRYHPPVSMIMERIVPADGLVLPDGRVVPGAKMAGMNPYIIGRNRGVFSDDADEFNPDRWLRRDGETEDEYKDRMQRWGQSIIAFGGGYRICLGRNISMMEIYKVVPTLLGTFDIALEDPNEQWWTCSRWFYRPRASFASQSRGARDGGSGSERG
ncbi:hypothetical protein VTG60DRAFT_667 [Thermothelomyces hinnuleus]